MAVRILWQSAATESCMPQRSSSNAMANVCMEQRQREVVSRWYVSPVPGVVVGELGNGSCSLGWHVFEAVLLLLVEIVM